MAPLGKVKLTDERKQSVTDKKAQLNSESRRKFITKAGKLAIYTPPAMIALMTPSLNTFAKSGGCNNGFGNLSEGCSPNPKGASYLQDE